MTPSTILDLIKAHGATGVLVIWILSLQSDIREIKHELFDCMESRVTNQTSEKNEAHERAYFVLPEKKRRKDGTCPTLDC